MKLTIAVFMALIVMMASAEAIRSMEERHTGEVQKKERCKNYFYKLKIGQSCNGEIGNNS